MIIPHHVLVCCCCSSQNCPSCSLLSTTHPTTSTSTHPTSILLLIPPLPNSLSTITSTRTIHLNIPHLLSILICCCCFSWSWSSSIPFLLLLFCHDDPPPHVSRSISMISSTSWSLSFCSSASAWSSCQPHDPPQYFPPILASCWTSSWLHCPA